MSSPQQNGRYTPRQCDLSAAFRAGKSSRDSYIKTSVAKTDTFYDVPGVAETILRSRSRGSTGFCKGSSGRDSYLKAQHQCKTDTTYDVPGIGSAKRHLPGPNFAKDPEVRRDSYIRTSFAKSDVFYDVPGVAASILRSKKRGTTGFLPGSSDRDSYIKAQRYGTATDAMYDFPGCGSVGLPKGYRAMTPPVTPRRSAAPRSTTPQSTTRAKTPPSSARKPAVPKIVNREAGDAKQ